MNGQSSLVATFAFISPKSHLSSTYSHNSTRPVDSYGPSRSWPLPFEHDDTPTLPSNLASFLAHSSAGQNLRVRVRDWREEQKRGKYGIDDQESTFNETDEYYAVFLKSHSWITMASDFSTYGLNGFSDAMNALKAFKVRAYTPSVSSGGIDMACLVAVLQSDMDTTGMLQDF
jgi:hypothetical protein